VAGISDLDLDIHVAKIDTRAGRVVDVFYVRTLWGTKLNDDQVTELTRSVTHRVERMFG
jgi:UTP:GlnB (protein PII) uridylyltransferase